MIQRFASLALVLCVLALTATVSVHAQSQDATESPVTAQGSIGFALGVPTGAFNQNVENLGYGINAYIGAEFAGTPFGIGLDFSFFTFGRSTRNVPFSETVGGAVRVDVVTTSSIVQPHLVFRMQPDEGVVRPYLEGLFGFKYLFTDTRVQDERREREEIASSRNFDDFTLSGGAGAGADIRLLHAPPNAETPFRGIYLNIGFQYVLGREAEYLYVSEGYDPDNPDIRRSTTNMIVPSIGISMQF